MYISPHIRTTYTCTEPSGCQGHSVPVSYPQETTRGRSGATEGDGGGATSGQESGDPREEEVKETESE